MPLSCWKKTGDQNQTHRSIPSFFIYIYIYHKNATRRDQENSISVIANSTFVRKNCWPTTIIYIYIYTYDLVVSAARLNGFC